MPLFACCLVSLFFLLQGHSLSAQTKPPKFQDLPAATKPAKPAASPKPPAANNPQGNPIQAPKPLVNLEAQDSLFVDIENEQYYLLHRMQPGETFYNLARFYAIQPQDIYANNPDYANGQKLLRIPIVPKAMRREPPKTAEEVQQHLPVYYRVKAGEGLYRVAKTYFRMPVEVIKTRNKLKSDQLKAGQVLQMAWFPKTGVPDSMRRGNFVLTGVLGEQNQKFKQRYEAKLAEKKEYVKEGLGSWPKGERLRDQTSLYVLYSGLKAGTIVKVENPMTQRTIYAEVVGPVPDSGQEERLVMLSPALAYALGALDAQLFVKVYFLR